MIDCAIDDAFSSIIGPMPINYELDDAFSSILCPNPIYFSSDIFTASISCTLSTDYQLFFTISFVTFFVSLIFGAATKFFSARSGGSSSIFVAI